MEYSNQAIDFLFPKELTDNDIKALEAVEEWEAILSGKPMKLVGKIIKIDDEQVGE